MATPNSDNGAIPPTQFARYDEWRDSLTPAQLARAEYVCERLGGWSLKDLWWDSYSWSTRSKAEG